MLREEAEYLISQYLDRDISRKAKAKVRKRMRGEPEMKAGFLAYRKVDRMLKMHWPVPEIRWDLLAERISESVARRGDDSGKKLIQSFRPPLAWVGAAKTLRGGAKSG
jgi:hypothetical protein